MTDIRVHQQEHGYRFGHELLASSLKLSRSDQDVVDRLSDISGPLGPGEIFDAYLTTYPLPSRTYYVLARTWQDLLAPRAGCVLTRSIFVPMKGWAAAQSVVPFTRLLRPVDRNAQRVSAVVPLLETVRLSPVFEPRTSELVESLFLEERQPILMFDSPEAELIAMRLLTALWPGLRATFSLCTFALSPRTVVETKPFDLLFAPKSARARFSEWGGRRIEPSSSNEPTTRHRWTFATNQQIFASPDPSLSTLDTLGALIQDVHGDESALRLTLLWNELAAKAARSPSAVLGLLDILKSQGRSLTRDAEFLTPLLNRSIEQATSMLPPSEAWTFLVTLLGKFHPSTLPKSVAIRVRRGAYTVTRRSLPTAIDLITNGSVEDPPLPPVLTAGLGDGLVEDRGVPLEIAMTFADTTLLNLVAYSRRFAAWATQSIDNLTARNWGLKVVAALSGQGVKLQLRARRNIVPSLNDASHEPVLAALLAHCNATQISRVALRLWDTTQFAVAAFDHAFRAATKSSDKTKKLREAILSVQEDENANRFLISTLRLEESDIRWLCQEAEIETSRVVTVIVHLLSSASDPKLKEFARHRDAERLLLDPLRTQPTRAAKEIARILSIGQPELTQLLALGEVVIGQTAEPLRNTLARTMLLRGLSEPREDKLGILTAIIRMLPDDIDAFELVNAVSSEAVDWKQLSENITLLGQVHGALRAAVLSHVDVLTQRLVSRPGEGPTSPAIDVWAQLLREAGQSDREKQAAAAASALRYAFQHTEIPITPLVLVAFPIVYEQLKDGIESSTLLSLFLFQDWDRCRTVREDLVNAFMHSSWPPADLLVAASAASDPQRILKLVSRKDGGGRYLDAIARDVQRIPRPKREDLISELAAFGRGT